MKKEEADQSKEAAPFMVFWREFPSQRYVSLIMPIPEDVNAEQFATNFLTDYMGRVSFLGKDVPAERYTGQEGFSLLMVEKIKPGKSIPFLVTWEDYEDEDTKQDELMVPVEKDPNLYAHDWLKKMTNGFSFSVCSIQRI